jgi:WXG100 family type VII secretion target
MPAIQVRIVYDDMGQIAKTFQQNSEDMGAAHKRIKAAQDTLADGDWIGQGAKKFQGEMESSINPSLQNLTNALQEASKVSNDISKVMQEADEEASNVIVIVVEA